MEFIVTEVQVGKSLLWFGEVTLLLYLQGPYLKIQPTINKNPLKNPYNQGVVAHTYNPSTQESETGGLVQVQYQPGLPSTR